MNIYIKWFGDQFNVSLSNKGEEDSFLSVKGCRIANGQNGPFVSWPSTKNQQTGKYWNHVWAGEKFASIVLSKAQESQPQERGNRRASGGGGDDSDVPFADPLRGSKGLAQV